MIPKSLGIALAAGMCSGIVAALVLADLRDDGLDWQEPAALAGADPSLVVLTDRTEYRRGQPIRVTVVNSGGVPITFADASFGMTVSGLAGETILSSQPPSSSSSSPENLPRPVLGPADRHTIVWNQQNDDGRQVTDGIYRISSSGTVQDADPPVEIRGTRTIDIYQIDLTFAS